MILLDTNIFSALMQGQPDKRVIEWLDGINPELLWTTSITVFEIQYGIELLATGKKKEQLHQAFDALLRQDFSSRVIEFELNAALIAGELSASRKLSGYNTDFRDIQIAGIASFHGAAIATRNGNDFADMAIELINPYCS